MCVYVRACERERCEGKGVRERWGREGEREREVGGEREHKTVTKAGKLLF